LVVFLALASAFFRQANSSDDFETFHWKPVIGNW
jgi:hypothetical protein